MGVHLSKNDRVLALIATMALASLAVGGVVFVVTDGDARVIGAATSRQAATHASEAAIALALSDQEGALDDYVLSGSQAAHQRYVDASTGLDAELARMRALALGNASILDAVDAVELAGGRWRDRVALPTIVAVSTGDVEQVRRFSDQAGGDHIDVDLSLLALAAGLEVADQDVVQQGDRTETVKLAGITIAFGFMLVAFIVAIVVVRRFGRALERESRRAGVLVRFTEVSSFATDDREIVAANLIALDRIAAPDSSVTHLLNRSLDRAMAEGATGDAPSDTLSQHALNKCAGMVRRTLHVNEDLSDALSVHCPVYPATSGTLACVPLISGEAVGAVHLYWRDKAAFPLEIQGGVSRIAEHAALAIGNRRLLAALHGQANTDPRTGLVNSRAFDAAVEEAMRARTADESASVLMIDVDHFKVFNDKYGHPAGDEALKAFASVLRSCMREGDIAARYGGEEFAVFLPGIGLAAAAVIAERIRARTEATVIGLAPGLTAKITISIGTASAPEQGSDRVTLLRLADEALYEAKSGGRNAVAGLGVVASIEPDRTREAEVDAAVPKAAHAPRRARRRLVPADAKP